MSADRQTDGQTDADSDGNVISCTQSMKFCRVPSDLPGFGQQVSQINVRFFGSFVSFADCHTLIHSCKTRSNFNAQRKVIETVCKVRLQQQHSILY